MFGVRASADQPAAPPDDGFDDYTRVRFHAAREVGLTKLEANRFAHGAATLHTLKKLKADGCPSATIARIVT